MSIVINGNLSGVSSIWTGPQGNQGSQGPGVGSQGFQGPAGGGSGTGSGSQGFQGLQGPYGSTSSLFAQGGNSFGTTAVLGTNDNNNLVIETNNTPVITVTTGGRVGIGGDMFDGISPEVLMVTGSNTYNIIAAHANINSFSQISIQNLNSGSSASSDFIAINDTGGEYVNYIDMGINSSTFNSMVGYANDSYMFNQGGNLWIGNYSSGTSSNIYFFTNGSTYSNMVLDYRGYIGLGTITPAYPLDVVGSARFTQGTLATSTFSATFSDGTIIDYDPILGNGRISVGVNDSLTIYSGGVGKIAELTISASNSVTVNNTLYLNPNQTPFTPATGVGIFSKSIANRSLLSIIDPSSSNASLQPMLARNRVGYWNPPGNSSALPGIFGFGTLFTQGTLTPRNIATSSLAQRMRRHGFVSLATAGASAAAYSSSGQFSPGSGTYDGSGFFMITRFVPSNAGTVAGERFFIGVSSATAAPSNIDPSGITNSVGVAQISADPNQLYIVYGGAASQSAIPLGTVSFPGSTLGTVAYELSIYAPNSVANTYYVQVTNIGTNATFNTTLSGNASVVPQSSALLAYRSWKTNNATAAAVAYDICSIYIETDN